MTNQEFAKKLIDKILDESEELNVAWHWGEESILVCDIIRLINEEAQMDYKKCTAYKSAYSFTSEYDEINPMCYMCQQHFTRYSKKEHRQHCPGKKDICDKYQSVL